jgi:hypothetical protein
MSSKNHLHLSDLVGLNRLSTDVTMGITDLTEALQNKIACSPGILGTPAQKFTSVFAPVVFEGVRAVTRLASDTTDIAISQLAPELDKRSSREREAVLAALNGIMGDYLAPTGNPLAITMSLRCNGQPLTLERQALAAAFSRPRDTSSCLCMVCA